MNTDLRFLLFVMDGLRPDLATPERMPNLHRLQRDGVVFSDARAAFPSETRVNQATLVTGCWPTRHGLVANQFIAPELFPDGLLNTGNVEMLIAADRRSDGEILSVPDLGAAVHAAGGCLAVLGSGTTGGNRILHRRARELGQLNMSLHGQDVTTTPEAAEAVLTAIGPVPAGALPNLARSRWLADAYMNDVAPRLDPTVTILWFSDPDATYHYRGIGSDEAAEAMAEVDRQLGRILDWRQSKGLGDRLNIVAVSDHGHISIRGEPVDLAGQLTAAGFAGDIAVAAGSSGGLYPGAEIDLMELVSWLQQQDWCGPLLTAGEEPLPGTLAATHANLGHPRTAPITFVLAADLEPDSGGHRGRTRHDNPSIPAGGSVHGGLTPIELKQYLALSGPSFGSGRNIDTPAGLVDIMPTLLHLLDIPAPGPCDGRLLTEALSLTVAPPIAVAHQQTVSGGNAFDVILDWHEVAGQRYLAGARRL